MNIVIIMANDELSVVCWNVNGLNTRGHEVHYYVTKHDVDVVLLQETRDRDGDALRLNGYRRYFLCAGDDIRGVSTYVKNTVPSELIEEPRKIAGVESVSVRIQLKEGSLNILNVYVSGNCFTSDVLPSCVFDGVTLLAGDINARHRALENEGRSNQNGGKFHQFLQDYPDVRLLGSKAATHIQGGRLDYACIVNGQGLDGECVVEPDLLSDHFALAIKIPLGDIHPLSNRDSVYQKIKRDFIHAIKT